MKQAFLYGAVVAVCIFFVGWITGLGGSFIPNLLFSLFSGAFAAALYVAALRWAGRRDE